MTKTERIDFLAHVRDLVDSADNATVTVEVEVDEPAEEAVGETTAADSDAESTEA